MEFIDLQAQLKTIRTEIDSKIARVLDHGQFIMGPEVKELEQALVNYTGSNYCVSCANGTDALQLALMALDVKEGDVVFTTAFSFFATAEVIPLVGATPYFCDIELQTYNLSPESLESAILEVIEAGKETPKAVIAVDLFGLPANYEAISSICKKYDIYLIEDAAQGFGGQANNAKVCSFGDIATTSFFPAKPLGCYGDGGAVFTKNEKLAEKLRSLRVHGKGKNKYDNIRIGLNSRLDTIQAAVLLAKLPLLDKEIEVRRTLYQYYKNALAEYYDFQEVPVGYKSSWAQITLRAKNNSRENVINHLQQHGIPVNVYYPSSLPGAKAFDYLQQNHLTYSNATYASQQVLSIPSHAYLTQKNVDYICEALIAVATS